MSPPEFGTEEDELRVAAEAKFAEMGMVSEYVNDPPGKVYGRHSHHEARLFGLGGSSVITLVKEMINMTRGAEVHIAEGVEHGAVVGRDGAQYLFAYPEGVEPFMYEP